MTAAAAAAAAAAAVAIAIALVADSRTTSTSTSLLKKCWPLTVGVWLALTVTNHIDCAHVHHKEAKDNRCHMLKKPGCDVSLYKILDFEEAGWFYHAPFKSCRPFYAAAASSSANDHESLCFQNRDLPLTREECEELCGEYCKLPNGAPGVCMLEGSCDIETPTSWNPRPCRAHNVQCCPKVK